MEQIPRFLTAFPESERPFHKAQEGQTRLRGLGTAVAETEQRTLVHYGISVIGKAVSVVPQGAKPLKKTHRFTQ